MNIDHNLNDIVNRCSISSLILNEQHPVSQKQLKENNLDSISSIGLNSKTIFRLSSTVTSIDVKLLTKSILASQIQMDTTDVNLLSDIDRIDMNRVKTDLLKSRAFLKEAILLGNTISHFDSSTSGSVSQQPLKFNIITQHMVNEEGEINSKKKRLGRQKVNVLEKWYLNHPEKPHLNEPTLIFLTRKTGLTKGQIRNWISNKRRKERDNAVSDSISQLLANQQN